MSDYQAFAAQQLLT